MVLAFLIFAAKKSITATFYKWCGEYDGMGVSMLTRMIGFEEENLTCPLPAIPK
jgi:hypothetical protein